MTSEYPPLPSGGIGTSIRNLARALSAAGHHVSVIGWGREAEFEDRGVHVRFLKHTNVPKMGWLLNRRLAQRELNNLVRADKLDIVEAPDWCGLSAGMRLKCPIVVKCHGTETYFASLLHETVPKPVRMAEQLALKQADSVVAVSKFTAETTRNLFRLKKQVAVIPNGIDVEQFQPAKRDEAEDGLILYLGTLVRKKGVLDLCRSFSRLLDVYPSARLVLIGSDAGDRQTGSRSTWAICEAELSPKAKERTTYHGPKPYEQIQGYLHRAALCVFPSYAEALPLAWMEAMACAKSIVAYDIGWAPEIIQCGTNGILAPKGDLDGLTEAMLGLLRNPELIRKLGAAARSSVENNWASKVVAACAVKHYEAMLCVA